MQYPTLDQANLQGKRVIMRAGFDVPMEGGVVKDTARIDALVPTMRYILDHGASLILMAHQGRPEGKDLTFSQKPLVPILAKLLSANVIFADSCTGDATMNLAKALQPGEVLLLENLRFDNREASKDKAQREAFAKELASLADLYVNDAFTNCHRDHASMTGVPKIIPGYLGLQVEKEVSGLSHAIENPRHPVTLIISGAKIETKVPVIEQFLANGDDILVGGCIANTLIAAAGFDVARSKFDQEFVEPAQTLMQKSEGKGMAKIHLPEDVIAATAPTAEAEMLDLPVEDIEADMAIFDVGAKSVEDYCAIIAKSGTIVWNGPLGFYEVEQFAGASKTIAQAVQEATANGAVSIIGGGDTLDFHERYGVSLSGYTFVSTAGGSMLDFISGKELPALAVLRKQ